MRASTKILTTDNADAKLLSNSEEDWEFVYSVNLKGVLNCIRAFVPGMLKQNAPGTVMATASQDGLCASVNLYGVTKHACVALMETLHGELRGRLTSHVLCPNIVATNILASSCNTAMDLHHVDEDGLRKAANS